MDHFEEAITLATSAHGTVKICPPGCIHLLFPKITLNFENPAEFKEMAKLLKSKEDPSAESIPLAFGTMHLCVSPSTLNDLLDLFDEASAALAWSDGDLQFTDGTIARFLQNNHLSE